MAEYIEREAFIKRLENEADRSSDIINLLILNGIANIVRDENIAPTADVVEVRHGHIIETVKNGKCNRVFSCCGKDYTKLTQWIIPNYCPNCGAKMDGKDVNNVEQ